MANCNICGTQTALMSGNIQLFPDDEPYESGKHEDLKSGNDEIDRYIHAQFCEKCDKIVEIMDE